MKLLVAMSAVLACSAAYSEVWNSSKEWSLETEAQYSNWVNTSFSKNIFTEHPKWKNISTDCADATYTARIIFSYENNLPFSIKDPTGSGNRITNKMSRWDSISDELQRVRKFIAFVNDVTDTKSLPNDTYPIAMNRTSVIPGTVWLRSSHTGGGFWDLFTPSEEPGHTETVTSVDENGTIHLLGSTVPPQVRNLIPTTTLVMAPGSTDLGFRRWILPQNSNLSQSKQPGYSLEQYSLNTTSGAAFETDVMLKISIRPETKQELVTRMATELCNLALSRIDVVKDALRYSQSIGRCMSTNEYDLYSTPSRDERVHQTAARLVVAANDNSVTSPDSVIDSIREFDHCSPLLISTSLELPMRDYVKSVYNKRISSNPNDPIKARWGVEASSTKCKR